MRTSLCAAIVVVTFAFPARAAPPMQCLGPVNEQVCGYVCERNYDKTACTRTPFGKCIGANNQLLCWDPPPALIAVLGDEVPAPECQANFGKVACGYHCLAQSGELKCAQTPYGTCGANFGKVECFDPPLQALSLVDGDPPRPSCVANFGMVACGYDCVANYGVVRCAQTPIGRCQAQSGTVVCVDPPVEGLPLVRRASKPVPLSQCIQFKNRAYCGYDCKSSGADAACARTPAGSCSLLPTGHVRCLDP